MCAKNNFFLILLLPFFSCVEINKDGTYNSNKKITDSTQTKSDVWEIESEFYTTYFLNNLQIEIIPTRPNKSDTAIQLCIPAAFTLLDNKSIDGLFICKGKIAGTSIINHRLGGGFLIINDSISIIKTNNGKILSTNFIDSISKLNASFFQQIQLVRDGEVLEFHKDQKLFQRRAVVIFVSGKIAMIESKTPITLQEFSNDLIKLQVQNAIYTDMGSYDEGWVRSPEDKTVKSIGKNRSQTKYQSNWLIFKK